VDECKPLVSGFGAADRIVEDWAESVRWKVSGHISCCRAGAGGATLALGGKGRAVQVDPKLNLG
jgi:hypothetical protein